jgi:hypothetical protein
MIFGPARRCSFAGVSSCPLTRLDATRDMFYPVYECKGWDKLRNSFNTVQQVILVISHLRNCREWLDDEKARLLICLGIADIVEVLMRLRPCSMLYDYVVVCFTGCCSRGTVAVLYAVATVRSCHALMLEFERSAGTERWQEYVRLTNKYC